MTPRAPGSYRPSNDHWGTIEELTQAAPEQAVWVADSRVLRLHPALQRSVARTRPRAVITLPGGERVKSLQNLERVLQAAAALPRSGTLIAVGGGTIGDLATVAAHVLKRGVDLVQVPTTLLAAVDSSLGGKGALDLRSADRRILKNAMGAFHYAKQTWLVPSLFETLTPTQLREGAIEAWKMAVCLDARRFRAWSRRPPELRALIDAGRAMKSRVCRQDPYEQRGVREVLNFGHTFGHVLESLSEFQLSHGDAVGLGMLFALDVGVAVGVTPASVAEEVEQALLLNAGVLGRERLASELRQSNAEEIARILSADKKAGTGGELRMILLKSPGEWEARTVAPNVWRRLLPRRRRQS